MFYKLKSFVVFFKVLTTQFNIFENKQNKKVAFEQRNRIKFLALLTDENLS